MTYPCPYCRSNADLATGCPGCGRGPNPDAAEVVRLDAEIATLTARMATAQQTLAAADAELRETWRRRQAAAARVRAAGLVFAAAPAAGLVPAAAPAAGLVFAAAPAAGLVSAAAPAAGLVSAVAPAARPTPSFPPTVSVGPAGSARPPRSPEASTKLIQNALFLLGGLLLGVAAIVFTAVAWSQFGVGGRAALLAAFTGAALAAPPIALRRGLSATAETFAAVGLLLVLLDGYAAWYVNLFGVADHSAFGYAGAVCAVTAAIAAGYEHITGLTGPRFVGLIVSQPVLPLLVAPLHPDASGWSFTLSAVALLNLAVVHLRRTRITPLGVTAYAFGLFSVVGAGSGALVALAVTEHPGRAAVGGAALITAALIPAVGATLARVAVLQAVALGGVVVAVDIAGARVAGLLGGSAVSVLVAAVATVIAMVVMATRPLLSPIVRRGPWIGALIAVAAPALIAVSGALDAAFAVAGLAQPAFHAPAAVPPGDWRLGTVLVLLTAASALLLPRKWLRPVIVTGAAMIAFTAPAAFGLPWGYAPALDLIAAAVALFVALRLAAEPGPAVAESGSAVAGPGSAVAGPGSAVAEAGRPGSAVAEAGRPGSAVAEAGQPGSAVAEAGPAGLGPRGLPARRSRGLPARRPGGFPAPVGWLALVAVVLAGHAVIVGFGRPGIAAATLSVVALLGLAVAALARRGGGADVPTASRLLGGFGLTIGLLAVPAVAWTAAAAMGASGAVQARLALAAAALLVGVLHAVSRGWVGYHGFALATVLFGVVWTPVWALVSGDSAAVYAGVSLISVALTRPAVAARRPASLDGAGRLPALPSGMTARSGLPVNAEARGFVGTGAELVWALLTAVPLGLALLTGAGSSLQAVLARPLAWTSQVWTGRPAGTGIDPFGRGHVAVADVVALVLLSVAAGLAAGFVRGSVAAAWAAAPAFAVAIPMALVAFDVAWPVVPAASLLAGLAGLLALALRQPDASSTGGLGAVGTGTAALPVRNASPAGTAAGQTRVALGVPTTMAQSRMNIAAGAAAVHAAISVGLVMAGLAGLLPTPASTLAGLGAVLVAGAAAGVGARCLAARVVGWLVAVTSALGVAFTAGRALDLPLPTTAFAVVGASAAALALGAALAHRSFATSELGPATSRPTDKDSAWAMSEARTVGRSVEARVVQAAAHAGAVVALLLTVHSPRHAAVVCTFWGLALGLRALLPGEHAVARRALVVAAAAVELAGWWLVIGAAEVSTLEAYTLPAAAVALLAGWLALRSRPGLSSWTAFGPALAAALLPTLASVLVGEGQPIRRLLLGLGALAVLLVGAQTRRQAPVLAGGVVLAAVALHELILVWDLMPRWIPLAAGGLLLVGLAMTLERRRRDLSRVRAALTRMS